MSKRTNRHNNVYDLDEILHAREDVQLIEIDITKDIVLTVQDPNDLALCVIIGYIEVGVPYPIEPVDNLAYLHYSFCGRGLSIDRGARTTKMISSFAGGTPMKQKEE